MSLVPPLPKRSRPAFRDAAKRDPPPYTGEGREGAAADAQQQARREHTAAHDDSPQAKPFDYGSGLAHAADKGAAAANATTRLAPAADPLSQQGTQMQSDAPACDVCGSITVRSGTCYKCQNCGNSMGCS